MKSQLSNSITIFIVSLFLFISANAGKPDDSIAPAAQDESELNLVGKQLTEDQYREMIRKQAVKPTTSYIRGGDSGGGGGMVVVSNGMVKLVDLIDPNEVFLDNIKNMSREEYDQFINNTLYKDRTPLNSLGDFAIFPQVFKADMLRKMEKFYPEFPTISSLAQLRCGPLASTIFMYKPRIKIKTSSSNRDDFYSIRLPKHIQEPVAYFNQNAIFLSARLITLMDDRHREALGVHECLRNLNADALEVSLTTSEIEALTRFFMNVSFPGDQKLIASAKAKSERPKKNVPWIQNAIEYGKARYDFNRMMSRLSSGTSIDKTQGETDVQLEIVKKYKTQSEIYEDDYIYQVLILQDCFTRLFSSMRKNELQWRKNFNELNQTYISDVIQAHLKTLPKYCK